jgi:DNA-binding LacI/PurR family transcriptional regulator
VNSKADPGNGTLVSRLADQILQDIRDRGLGPGERYLNGQEIADQHSVTVITANRALQRLAERGVVERRQRAGTFIARQFHPLRGTVPLRCVHLLMPVAYFRASRTMVEAALYGLHSALPDCHLQFTFIPSTGELVFLRELIERAKVSEALTGMVLYVSSVELQQFMREAGIPAVVFGSVYPAAGELPWVDRDQRQIGQLLGDFVLQEQHERVAVLMRDRWGYGDNLLFVGIQKSLAAAKTNQPPCQMRSIPSIPELGAGILRALLTSDDAPTALICRCERIAELAAYVALQLGLKVPRQLRIVAADQVPGFPCVVPQITQEEQGAIVGRMLKQLNEGIRPTPDHLLVPVAFHNPSPKQKYQP